MRASLATLNLVTASQMAGQLCALICASPRVCVCVCLRGFYQLSLSGSIITGNKQTRVIV